MYRYTGAIVTCFIKGNLSWIVSCRTALSELQLATTSGIGTQHCFCGVYHAENVEQQQQQPSQFRAAAAAVVT